MSARSGSQALLVLAAIKVAIAGWNAHAYHGRQYDADHHVERARNGGLEMTAEAYNPPLYYLPALATRPLHGDIRADRLGKRLLRDLRYTNVVYLGLTYALWLGIVIPAFIRNRRAALAVSLFVLAVPGFNKLAMMAHPDNLMPLGTAACLALWIRQRRRALAVSGATRSGWGATLATAAAIGALGLTRPFAAAPVAVLCGVLLLDQLTDRPWRYACGIARCAAIIVVVGTISLSWFGYRYAVTGQLGGAYNAKYIERYARYRAGFDFLHYFGSFYPRALAERPNRTINELDRQNDWPENRYANSFLTTLHSEIWGDHWLYVSGPVGEEHKLWPKRVMLVAAMPILLLVPLGLLRTAAAGIRAGPRRIFAQRETLALVLLLCVGAALYLYWQTGSGLLPGKNSTIKFIYFAYLVPVAAILALRRPVSSRAATALTWYAAVLYSASLPVALFVP